MRDLVGDDCAAIRVDDEAAYERMKEFLEAVAPALAGRLELYGDPMPLFDRFGVEPEIENALKSRVSLPSGGSIVIHQTEALVAIDVNTGRFVGKDALEETVFAVNLEAVSEVARQIRLRDLGGLLVVDFIDMEQDEHRTRVFERFQEELARDRARTRVLQISEFGLIELTRQRFARKPRAGPDRGCPACSGSGSVKSDRTVALDLRRPSSRRPKLFTAERDGPRASAAGVGPRGVEEEQESMAGMRGRDANPPGSSFPTRRSRGRGSRSSANNSLDRHSYIRK